MDSIGYIIVCFVCSFPVVFVVLVIVVVVIYRSNCILWRENITLATKRDNGRIFTRTSGGV